jgi:hypothetical protein
LKDIKLKMTLLKESHGVCRLSPGSPFPDWAADSAFLSMTRTTDELSIVCLQSSIPEGVRCEKEWRILKVEGPLDFSLIGIIAKISSLLAEAGISLFVISTFDTDYLLVKGTSIQRAIDILTRSDYEIMA